MITFENAFDAMIAMVANPDAVIVPILGEQEGSEFEFEPRPRLRVIRSDS